jgi:hypothetical protein
MPKRPGDPNQIAKQIVDIAIGEVEDTVSGPRKLARRKGRTGGLKGGKARARHLTPKERTEIAKLSAQARWKK